MFNKLRISTAEQFVFHSLLSLVIGAGASGGMIVGQGIFHTGANIPALLSAGGAAFLAWFTHGFVALRSSPQMKQAESDAGNQFGQAEKSLLADLQSGVGDLANKVDAVISSHQQLIAFAQGLAQQVRQVQSQQKASIPMPTPPTSVPPAQVPFPSQMDTMANAAGVTPQPVAPLARNWTGLVPTPPVQH